MKKSIFSALLIFLALSCEDPDDGPPVNPPVDPVGMDDNTSGTNEDPQNNDPLENPISEFSTNIKRIQAEDYYVKWDTPIYPDSLEIKYNIYANDILIDSLPEESTAHILGCENFENSSVLSGRIEAFDQYGNTRSSDFTITKPITPDLNEVSLPRIIPAEFVKLNNGGYLYYSMENGNFRDGYDNMRLRYYDDQFMLLNDLMISVPPGFTKLGGNFPSIPNIETIPNYFAADVDDGIVFCFVSPNLSLPQAPFIFKISYAGEFIWQKTKDIRIDNIKAFANQGLTFSSSLNQLVFYSGTIFESPGVQNEISYVLFDSTGDYVLKNTFEINPKWSLINPNLGSRGPTLRFMENGWVLAYTSGEFQDDNAYLSKIDFSGSMQWTLNFGPVAYNDEIYPPKDFGLSTRISINPFSKGLTLSGFRFQSFYNEQRITGQNPVGVHNSPNPFFVEVHPDTGEILDFHEFYQQDEWHYFDYQSDLSIKRSPASPQTSAGMHLFGSYTPPLLQVHKVLNGYIYVTSSATSRSFCVDYTNNPFGGFHTVLKTDFEGNILWQKEVPTSPSGFFIQTDSDMGLFFPGFPLDGSNGPHIYSGLDLRG